MKLSFGCSLAADRPQPKGGGRRINGRTATSLQNGAVGAAVSPRRTHVQLSGGSANFTIGVAAAAAVFAPLPPAFIPPNDSDMSCVVRARTTPSEMTTTTIIAQSTQTMLSAYRNRGRALYRNAEKNGLAW